MNAQRPPSQQVGLVDWFDAAGRTRRGGDPMLLVGASKPRRTRSFSRRVPRVGRTTRALAGAAAAVAVLAGSAVALSGGFEQDPESGSAAVASAPSTTSVPAAALCGPATEPGVVRGNGPGGTDSGPASILAFEHAYYVLRDGAKAREVVAPDAAVSEAPVIQAGAETVPPDTTHCVVIRPAEPGQYAVELAEHRPDGEVKHIRQLITTQVLDGRTVITAITRG